MVNKLFKTKKLAEEYVRENYPDLRKVNSCFTERTDYDTDMVNLCWSGETPAWDIEDNQCNTVARVGWWEEGDDKYELYVGAKLTGVFDNIYDAREAFDKAVEVEEYKDEDEEEIFEVKLLCNGEDISN